MQRSEPANNHHQIELVERSSLRPMQRLDVLDANELNDIIKKRMSCPSQQIFYPDGTLKHTVYCFPNNLIVAQDRCLGGGFWGKVFLGAYYDLTQANPMGSKCVVKLPHQSDPIKQTLSSMLNLNKKMVQEASLNKAIHGMGMSLTCENEGKTITVIVMPFLGDISLEKILGNDEKFYKISCFEWLLVFRQLGSQLKQLHDLGQLHNDIKPENIQLTLDENGHVLAASFIDLGNAHKINKTGSFGDPNYQPLESITIGFWCPNVKKPGVDIYALGASLQKVTDKLLKNAKLNQQEREVCIQCKALFSAMTAFCLWNRPALDSCLLRLQDQINDLTEDERLTNEVLSSSIRRSLGEVTVTLSAAAAAAAVTAAVMQENHPASAKP